MGKRFVSIWFRYLATDWFAARQPRLRDIPFVLTAPSHGRMIVVAANVFAQNNGIYTGMTVADARAMIPALEVLDNKPGLTDQLLQRIGEWCIRFAPHVATDPPDGLLIEASGCSHLWGGDEAYLNDIVSRLQNRGYYVRAAIADTLGAAWGFARFEKNIRFVPVGQHMQGLLSLPPAALRLDTGTTERLHKLGLRQINDFINMPRSALKRRFGQQLVNRLDQALGVEEETMQLIYPAVIYQERLPCLEVIVTATGIEIALQRLLTDLCHRLQKDGKGLRTAFFRGYRQDGGAQGIEIGTARPTHSVNHLFQLFQIKISTVEPRSGIELFILEATKVEDYSPVQEKLWSDTGISLEDTSLAELIDRLAGKLGPETIKRFLPDEHYWPERSVKKAASLDEQPATPWKNDRPRPVQLLDQPARIEVMAPIPDYPPMLFRYKGKLHKIIKADGPERIEQEWWIEEGQHRDYYCVEDEEGHRYWLFRSGHYTEERSHQWFLHGFFA